MEPKRPSKFTKMDLTVATTFFVLLFVATIEAVSGNLTEQELLICNDNYCRCQPSKADPELIDVMCKCTDKQKVLKIGGTRTEDALAVSVQNLPEKAAGLFLEQCHHVELFARTFNNVPTMKDVTISGSRTVVLHPRLYDSRAANAKSGRSIHLNSFEISDVTELNVARHAFEGVSMDGAFILKGVSMQRMPSLAFNFDSVKEFNIIGSTFDRISMWGIKLTECGEFNVLGGSRFLSMASQALKLRCNKFMLAYNTFEALQDSSFNIEYGFADIQGNTFESLGGRPFLDMKPLPAQEVTAFRIENPQLGLVFRENMFSADPSMPFNALSMPAFGLLGQNSYIDIDMNHFQCDCDKVAWFIGAMVHGFDREALRGDHNGGRGSYEFLRKIYETSGKCLECDVRSCRPRQGGQDAQTFKDFAQRAMVVVRKGQLRCASSDQTLQGHNNQNSSSGTAATQGGGSGEEGSAEVKNGAFSTSSGTLPQPIMPTTSIILRTVLMGFSLLLYASKIPLS